MKTILAYLLSRAAERSTWLGLVSIATALGLLLSQAQQDAIVAAGMAAAGLIAALTGDKKAPPAATTTTNTADTNTSGSGVNK